MDLATIGQVTLEARKTGRPYWSKKESKPELLLGRLHVTGVEGAGDRQADGTRLGALGQPLQRLNAHHP